MKYSQYDLTGKILRFNGDLIRNKEVLKEIIISICNQNGFSFDVVFCPLPAVLVNYNDCKYEVLMSLLRRVIQFFTADVKPNYDQLSLEFFGFAVRGVKHHGRLFNVVVHSFGSNEQKSFMIPEYGLINFINLHVTSKEYCVCQ